jgi:hypothetical protein|tara:strand:+ start:57 stop:728 length:672 start_codon:yes stop_codon:yes gene_type:complete
MEAKNRLPVLKDLVNDVAIYEKTDELNFLLNQEPPKKWVKEHPFVRGHKYVPIDKVEFLLRKIFKKYRIEILREGTSFNGVYVCVRVHYLNPVSSEWDFHDGIGAIHLQVKKGSSPSDLANINNGALSMAYPLAKTLAIKDACDMFGKLFGSDLNRRDSLPASMDAKKQTNEEKSEEIKLLLDVDGLTISEDDRMNIERILDQKETSSYDKCLILINSNLPKK